ncbi:MAG: hypothetical protein IPF53_13065 [Blastocatellia bacterium]|nr:hypothetical protein [Blastocatellia bacterium]MBK6425761.1 hypothetical protein [Blastocatellia bacterium]
MALFSTTINAPRVALAGLLAGALINLCDIALLMLMDAEPWSAVLRGEALTGSFALPLYRALASLIAGVFIAWLYAALRSTLGRGAGAGSIAAVVTWILAHLYAAAAVATGSTTWRVFAVNTGGLLVGYLVGGIAGARLYDRTPGSSRKPLMGRRR